LSVNKLTNYGYSVCYKITENASRVKIATAVTNHLLANPQKTIFTQNRDCVSNMLISGAGHGTSQFFTNSNLDVLAAFLDTHLKNTSDVDESKYESQVKEIKLSQNYPNLFNNRTVIKFELPVPGMTSIKIFNVAGKEVSTLINEELSAGHHQIVFDAANLASGEYYYQMRSGDFYQTRIFTLVK